MKFTTEVNLVHEMFGWAFVKAHTAVTTSVHSSGILIDNKDRFIAFVKLNPHARCRAPVMTSVCAKLNGSESFHV